MKIALRWLLLVLAAFLALQLFFVLRIALMAWIDPQSTAFQRSEAWRLATEPGKRWRWRQEWVPYGELSDHLKRAVIASEDDSFTQHDGLDWEAIESAWERNARAERQAARRARLAAGRSPRIIGGSTITQQLAKNLFLSGERTLLRKGQEAVLTLALEILLPKERILELYLNSVEWGEGVFGAEAAARRYHGKSASQLSAWEAARLAVMLPRPKHYEKLPQSDYLADRAGVISARMRSAQLP
ncbi:monofunctional biosynthetic peptidoglycan transglycosylase [Ramlibacter rhizophilus]|uniref:Biosynthetic peptidoglycan transglycosylase n=1 Tax=Ramlibacter rhizophilus TaxID=1781167 RepID=A0A4Z0BU55_9BURK|nr:monofunctional biosynthetic peptidoglycan transglycosylase [Ramlibacter rhizophilus]TFZ01535.1 monofunctional biosynthetic peptidoglycan transglycosylase [Ramlibacter rhizophilus]